MLAYIPFIYFTIWLIIHLTNPRMRFGAGAMTLLWIDISAFFSILLDARNLYGEWGCNDYSLSWISVISYCLLWSIVIFPILKLDQKELNIVPTDKTQAFSYICIFFIICVIIYTTAVGSFDSIIQQLQVSRNDAYEQSGDNSAIYQSKNRFLLWIPMIVSNSSVLLLLFYFISETIIRQRRLVRWGLLLSSLLILITSYAGGGRAHLIWWVITFFIFYAFFYPYMTISLRKKLLLASIILTTLSFSGLLIITFSRFDSSVYSYALNSLIGYAGQTLNNYSSQLPYVNFPHLYTERLMPLTTFLQTHQPYDAKEYYTFLSTIYPIQVSVFFSVFGDILMDCGYLGLSTYILIYLIIVKLIVPHNNQIALHQIFIFAIICCIPVRGVFSYPFTRTTETLFILTVFMLYLFFRYTIIVGEKKF